MFYISRTSQHKRIQELNLGAKVAEGASRVEAPKVVVCGEGAVPPPQKLFLAFKVKCRIFVDSVLNFVFFYDHNSIEIQL